MSVANSRAACLLTIKAIFLPSWDLAPESCYLHTLTFADPEPDYREARRRWASFTHWLNRSGFYGVAVPQFGTQTRRLHFHLVTCKRPESREWWDVLGRYGFGRYDVRERPVAVASYAARYVARRDYWPSELRGMRSWSVFGQKHFRWPPTRTVDVKIRNSRSVLVAWAPQGLFNRNVWSIGDDRALIHVSRQLRPSSCTEGSIMRARVLGERVLREVRRYLDEGQVIGVGEYRQLVVDTRETRNERTGLSEKRVVVRHEVELGVEGVPYCFEEWLTVGRWGMPIEAPAKSGELVCCLFESLREFKGTRKCVGKIVRLDGCASLVPAAEGAIP